jgi:hypothetical protein
VSATCPHSIRLGIQTVCKDCASRPAYMVFDLQRGYVWGPAGQQPGKPMPWATTR